ncbi:MULTISPECIES: siderophore ABC transporter substrate-binding protein [unclassified Corynebacterium]|uniref:siderophore ABC transporter substrate-binding protein n=1 Tax=unclassified Corynebacterium TaxID=2624378 RepID=UPI0030B7943C
MANTRIKLLATATALGLALTGCSNAGGAEGDKEAQANGDTISVEDNHGTQNVPANAEKVAVTDNRSFEILSQWEIPLVAAPKALIPFTVDSYKNDDSIADMGTHKEPNLEALVAAQPDLVVNGQRFAKQYEDIKKLNPQAAVVEFEPREDKPFDEEIKRQTELLGTTFGKEEEATKLIEDFDKALERAKKAYDPSKKVMAINVSGGEIGYIAPSVGRTYGPLFDLIGMTPALKVENASDNHEGDDVSVETIAKSNPDWVLILDRDAGTNTRNEAEYKPAKDVIEGNEALKNVSAIKDSHVVYAPEDTYTNENIITYTEILNSMADAFESAK